MLKKTQPPPLDRILRFMALWFFCFSLPAYANSGLNWLANQVHTGGISTPDDVATTFQSTAEALRTVHVFGEDTTFSSIVEFGQQILNTENDLSTENLSRRLIATAQKGDNVSILINELLALQNPDGGFGQRSDFDSTVLNTAFALEALAIAKASEEERIVQAITFLTNHQNLDGSFRLNSANENALYVTALTASALQRLLFQAQVTDYVEKANQYLLNKISQDQVATDWELALTLLSVASATADSSLYKTAASILRSHQGPNGSWDNDVYITALALRALHHVRRIQFPVDPNKGIFTGRVLDDNTGLPLSYVTVLLETIDSAQTLTESDGTYGIAGLEPGIYTLKYQLAGYNAASLPSVSLTAGQFADLGTLRLIPLPDVGIITGIITDMNTNQPLSNAQVTISGAMTTSVLTEDDGHYSIISPPGPVTVTVSKMDYDSVTGSGTVNQGATLKFSPALNPTGTTPQNPEVTVKGILKDSETGAPLNDVLITIVGTDYQGRSDDTGAFSIPGVAPGELTIEMSLTGYQVGCFTVLAPSGSIVDLDTTHLPKTVPIPTTTLIGQVRNANTGDPIEGANVTLATLNSGALTSEDGSYRIEGIDVLEFKVSANAVNYLTTSYTLSVNQAGLVTVDFNLTPAAESPLEISALSLEQSNYDALSAVHINVVLNNKETAAQPVRLSIKVVNEEQQIVEQFTPVINSLVTVEPNSPLSTQVEWQTARHLPGHYELIVQAFDGNSGQLLAEQGTQISVEPTHRLGGHVAFEPPIAQLAAKKPVQITATVANQGNQPLEASTLTATLSLKNPGYQQHKHEVLVEPFVEEHELMNQPRGIAQDAAGNFYVADYNNHSVLKITPEGTVSEFATDLFYPIDVDLDYLGNLYVLSYYSNRDKGLVRLGMDGSRTEFKLSIGYSQAIEALDDGRILIAAGNTLYAVTLEDNNANVTTLVAGGLNGPRNLIADSQGNLFITDLTGNAVVKFSDNELSIFAEIKQPSGITIDANDNLYVTSFSDNSLLKITPDGQQSIIATGLSGPYDVKIAPEGNAIAPEGHFVVSNQHSHEIVTITPTGDISTLVQPIFYGPRALTYDAEGNLYIANYSRRNIVKLATDGGVTDLSDTIYPRDILALDNQLYWLESNSLSTIGPNDSAKTTLTSQLKNPYALIKAPDGHGFFVSEYYGHRISRVSTTGEITPYTTTLPSFISPRSIRRDAQDHLYLLSDNGYIIQLSETGQIIRVISDLSSPTSLAIDNAGNLIVPEYYKKRILRIAPNGNSDEIANQLDFYPYASAVNSQGDIVVAPWNSDTLYLIKNGEVSEYAKLNEGTTGYDMLFDTSDNLWLSQHQQHKVLKLSADLTEQKIYSLINNRRSPQALFLDGAGGILVGGNQFIQRIDNQGEITELVYQETISGQNIRGIALDKNGQLWTADFNSGVLSHFNTDYTLNKRYTSVYYPKGIAWVDNSLIVANTSRKQAILRITHLDALPEIILDGFYEQMEAIDAQTVLLSNASSVSRFDLTTGELTPLVSGFSDIEALTVGADGRFVVADYGHLNELAFYNNDGTLRDSFVGLFQPKALLFDAKGQLLISNNSPRGISRVRTDGHLELFSSVSAIESMWLESDGQITVSDGNYIRELSNTGELLTSYPVPSAKGLFRSNEGDLWVASQYQKSLFKMAADGSYQKIASGLSLPYDIEVDLAGNIHIADRSQKAVIRVSEDNALSLVATDLPEIEAITFTPDGSLFVAYNKNQIARLDSKDERTELPLAEVIPYPNITGLISDSKGILYPVMFGYNSILKKHGQGLRKIQLQMAEPDIQPGEVVYTATAEIQDLSLEGEAISVDFGAWIPTLSGDFELQVTANTPTTTAQLNNTLHVGPSANGTLNLAQSQVFPGDRNVTAYLSLKGADSTSITQINAQGTTLAALSGTSGYGLAADNQGNIYSVDSSKERIVQITPNGTMSDFVTIENLGYGLAIDAQDHIYAIRTNEILKITPPSADMTTPQVTTFATLSGNVGAVAIGYDNQVYAVDSSNRLSQIAADGSVKTLTTVGINTPKALTIDVFGNFYVLNMKSGNDSIIKITPDGKSSSVYFDQANFEFEGVNVTADCSNNLLFAPFGAFALLDKDTGEEDMLVQLIGDTGEVREVLYGPSIDQAMSDMDVLFYDRFGERILIWTDVRYLRGKIFSFPVICGGIDVDVHIKTRSDVDLASSDPGPTSLIDLGDGTQEAIWNLTQVDNQGQKVQLNLQFNNLVEGETRPAVQDAFLVFHNSFDPDNSVQVPVTIPELLATRQMHIVPMLTDERYGPETPVEIQVEVLNNSDTNFNGILELTIADSNDQPVAQLPPIAVTDLTGPTSQFYTSQWNTGTTYAGNYKLVSRLIEPVRTYDEAELTFEILAPDEESQLSLRTTTDKSDYHTTDVVLINNLVENGASNRLMDDALVTVTITDPKGQIIHTDSQPLGLLAPQAVRELRMPYSLPENAKLGTYAIQITIADSDTQLASQQTSFTVTEQIDLALLGHVEVQLARLTTNQTQTCTETITHQGTLAINGLALQQVLLDLDTLAQIDVQTTTVDLVAGAQQTFTRTFEALKPSHYACVLQMQREQDWKTLDFKTFTVTGTLSSECSTVYAIHDQDVSDTQIFTYELNTHLIRPLGPLYPGYDLEGLDLHPYTHQLYASSGKKRARLYHVDGDRGELNLIGDIGFSHVHALSFHPDGSLWGWSRKGLIQIDIDTGQGQLVYADNKNIEGLAWNQNGTLLYGTLYNRPQRRSTLWVYDGHSLTKSCTNLHGEVESLEIRPDGKLLFGVHEQQDMNFHVYDVETCEILVEAQISTAYYDIEAIAWPNQSCSTNENALKAFLTALSGDNVFIGEDRYLRITLEGQTHRGQLAEEITSGPAPIGNNLYLKALPDANEDGIDDFRIIYPNGDEQILYYFGTD